MDCSYELEIDPNSTLPVRAGNRVKLRLKPALKPTCIWDLEIKGAFQEKQRGAGGDAEFEATEDNPKGSITAIVQCEDPKCGRTRTNAVQFAGVVQVNDDQKKGKIVAVVIIVGTSVLVGVLLGSTLGPAGSVTGGAIGAVVGSILSLGLLRLWN